MNYRKIKLYLFAAVLSLYMVQGYLFRYLLFFNPKLSQRLTCNSIYYWGILIRKVLGINVSILGDKKNKKGVLSVSNHPSYLDFFVIPALSGLCYVSPIDLTSESKFFHYFVKGIGCILVNRKSRDNQEQETKLIEEALLNNIDVHFFPEAKTNDGLELLRFRRPLFKAATDLNSLVQIITINYLSLDGEDINTHNKDMVHWYRQNSLNKHFWNILKYKRIDVQLVVETKSISELLSTHEHIADSSHSIVSKHLRHYL